MKCPKCGSTNVSAQMVSETQLKKKHSLIYWLFVGWWLEPMMWLAFFLPMLFIKIFKPKNYKMTTSHKTMCVCQECGKSWAA